MMESGLTAVQKQFFNLKGERMRVFYVDSRQGR